LQQNIWRNLIAFLRKQRCHETLRDSTKNMERVAIIGNAGGGKSVLARKLGVMLDLPVYQFDDLQWQPGWKRAPEDEIWDMHTGWLAQPGWIIDGWGSWEILGQRFAAADTILFVDFPIYLHYWWAVKRQVKAVFNLSQDWPPEGCPALPVTVRLFKLIWTVHFKMRAQLVALIDQYALDTRVIRLQSARDMRSFLGKMGMHD
jgi:hypothetical protein